MTTEPRTERAGGSQFDEARVCRVRAEQYAVLQQRELDLALRHEAAGRGEASVAATLQALTVYSWRVLVDRQWPRSAGNVDVVLVGPGGVVVVDAKTWAEPRVEGGRLYRGDADETAGLDALTSSVAPVVADVLGAAGYAPAGVVVAVVLAGRSLRPTQVSGSVVVGEADVAAWVRRRGNRVDAAAVDRLAELLDDAFPPHQANGRHVSTTTLPLPLPREKPAVEVATRTNAAAARWLRLLVQHGLPGLDLQHYRGAPVDAVKVGTVHRAKGLEFAHVVVPDAVEVPPRHSGESEEAYEERAEVCRRQVHVAMTRARDTLWCGRVVGLQSTRSALHRPAGSG